MNYKEGATVLTKIGLISDSNTPSLPLMKISAFHKAKGNIVKLVDDFSEKFDLLYVSKTFNLDLKKINDLSKLPPADKIIFGGSGYAIEVVDGREVYRKEYDKDLPPEIENIFPDYSLYGSLTKNTACGFLSRGCPNNCDFCIVSKKDGLCSRKVADLKNFWNGQSEIKIFDPNLLACKDREKLLLQLAESKAKIDYTQGLDARLIDEDSAKLLCCSNITMAHFAFDLMKNEKRILKGLEIFNKYFKKGFRSKRVYILTNYNTTFEEDWYRIKKVNELGYLAYVMIYQKGTHSRFLTDLARWSNNVMIHQATSFEDYIPRKDGLSVRQLYPHILNAV